MQDSALWDRLVSYHIGRRVEPPFVAQLKELDAAFRWRADMAILEYKRFLYLTQVSDGPLTPSKTIDKVWHLHLTYTRDYWEDLCANILPRPLHHEPTDERAEEARLQSQYAATLALYRREFGQDPPRRFWERRLMTLAEFRRQHVVATVVGVAAAAVFGVLGWSILAYLAGIFAALMLMSAFLGPNRSPLYVSGGDGGGGCGGGGCGG